MSAYEKTVKKKLLFKGDSGKMKKRKVQTDGGEGYSNVADAKDASEYINENSEQEEVKILSGTGRITSSGTTIHGHDTKFMTQLSAGDAIIISHPMSMRDETKIVKMVLSDVSIGVSSGFSSDLISTASFKYIKAPKDEEAEDAAQQKGKKRANDAEAEAFGTYASDGGQRFTYRERKPGAYGGYRIVNESTGTRLSREALLDKRAKKKADRFCY